MRTRHDASIIDSTEQVVSRRDELMEFGPDAREIPCQSELRSCEFIDDRASHPIYHSRTARGVLSCDIINRGRAQQQQQQRML